MKLELYRTTISKTVTRYRVDGDEAEQCMFDHILQAMCQPPDHAYGLFPSNLEIFIEVAKCHNCEVSYEN
jgi:hypothetical protein